MDFILEAPPSPTNTYVLNSGGEQSTTESGGLVVRATVRFRSARREPPPLAIVLLKHNLNGGIIELPSLAFQLMQP